MEDRRKRVAHYLRVSSDPQSGSLDGHLNDLQEFSAKEGHRVVAEIRDQAEKRHILERPGIDELLDLAAAGGVDEVWAWAWDRYGEFPVPENLAIMLAADGVSLRALDDGGEGEDADDMRVVKSLFSRREQRSRSRRSRKGKRDKARRGQVLGAGFRPRYGFRYVRGRHEAMNREVTVGYEVDPETMEYVRRVFTMLAAGESLHAIQRELEQAGVSAPGGGRSWSRTTIKNIALEDVYRPHGCNELEGIVSADVLAGLDPEKPYGIYWFGKRRTSYKPGRGKSRVVEMTPRESWIAVPVDLTGSGLDRVVVDRARAAVKDNRSPSKVGDRLWELSGVLFCGECGRRMISYRRAKKSGYNNYYRCRPGSTVAECSNRRSHPAERLEYHAAVDLFERHIDEGELLALYDQAVEERDRRSGRCASPQRRAALAERLEALTRIRRGFQDQQAEGLMTLAELRERLAELDEEKEGINAELLATEQAVGDEGDFRAMRHMLEEIVRSGQSYMLKTREQLRKDYLRVGARFEVDQDGTLTLRLNLDLSQTALHQERTY